MAGVDWKRWYRLLLISLVYMASMSFLALSLTMDIGFAYLGWSPDSIDSPQCYANSTRNKPFPINTTEYELIEANAKNVTERFQFVLKAGFYIFSVLICAVALYFTPCV